MECLIISNYPIHRTRTDRTLITNLVLDTRSADEIDVTKGRDEVMWCYYLLTAYDVVFINVI